jgi:hypothetical protein
MGARAARVVDLLSEVITELHCRLARIRSAVGVAPSVPTESDLRHALRLAEAEGRLREVRSHIANLVRQESHVASFALRPFSSPFGKTGDSREHSGTAPASDDAQAPERLLPATPQSRPPPCGRGSPVPARIPLPTVRIGAFVGGRDYGHDWQNASGSRLLQ